MSAYYNEFDPYAAQWLRNLIAAGHIPAGEVDERSIVEVAADDVAGFRQCHFFAGIGGWALAGRIAGWPDDRAIWTGSCPCQPFSAAGLQRGMADDRHLWPAFFGLIEKCRPTVLFGEQVAAAARKGWLDQVFDDLEGAGYACAALNIPACAVGAQHKRERLWFCADAEWNEQPRQESCGRQVGRMGRVEQPVAWDRDCERALPKFRALDDGVPRRVGATDAARNAIVPQVAAEVIAAYMDCAP